VVEVYSQREPSSYTKELDDATKEVTNECGTLIRELFDRLRPKYHESLQLGGSGNVVKDWGKKITWSFREQEVVREFQEKLAHGVQRLTLLMSLATR